MLLILTYCFIRSESKWEPSQFKSICMPMNSIPCKCIYIFSIYYSSLLGYRNYWPRTKQRFPSNRHWWGTFLPMVGPPWTNLLHADLKINIFSEIYFRKIKKNSERILVCSCGALDLAHNFWARWLVAPAENPGVRRDKVQCPRSKEWIVAHSY